MGAAALANVLGTCTASTRCRSAACRVCGRGFQTAAVSTVDHFIGGPARAIRHRMHAVTLVPAVGCLEPEGLTVEAFTEVKAVIAAAYHRLGLPPAIIGLEASFNEDATGELEPHWCIHGHSVGLDWLSDAQKAGLRAEFPSSSGWVKRAIYTQELDQDIRGRRYPFKPERSRRVTELVTDDPKRGPYRDTGDRPLRPWQAVTLAMVEHELGFRQRLLIHDIDGEAVLRHLRGLGWAWDGP